MDRNTVAVSGPSVRDPLDVRYAWLPYPDPPVNLFNSVNLPASPFSTETKEGVFGQGTAATRRPNILFIVSEDNSEHLGCYGEKRVHTPHLDQLASAGVRIHTGLRAVFGLQSIAGRFPDGTLHEADRTHRTGHSPIFHVPRFQNDACVLSAGGLLYRFLGQDSYQSRTTCRGLHRPPCDSKLQLWQNDQYRDLCGRGSHRDARSRGTAEAIPVDH